MSSITSAMCNHLPAAMILLIGAIALPSAPASQEDPEARAPATQEAMETDMIFTAGERVILTEATTDDLFAAGSMVETRGARADHLFIAGGDITVSDADVNDVIAAGGEIRLNAARVADDIIVAGGDIVVGERFEIGGTAVIAGGHVRFEAPVGQDLRIGASEIFVDSTVPGTARLSGEQIVLGPNARIGGDLLYRGDSLTVDPAAVIEGKRTELPMSDRYVAEDFGKGAAQLFMYFSLSILVSYFVIVLLLVFLAPGLMRSASEMIRGKPLQSLGIGVLYALIVPLLVFLLISTALAAPLALLLIAISVALTPLALAVTAYFVGMSARRLATKDSDPPKAIPGRILWPALGTVIVFGLTLIPVVGLLVWLLAMLFGLGAFARQASGALTARASG